MIIQVFRGAGRVCAFVRVELQEALPRRYGPWECLASIELTRGEAHPSVLVNDCLDDIADFGVHVTDAGIRITPDALG